MTDSDSQDGTSSAGAGKADHLQPWTIPEFCFVILAAIAAKQVPANVWEDEPDMETATAQVLLRFPCAGFLRIAPDNSPVYTRSPEAIKRTIRAVFCTREHHALEDALRLCGKCRLSCGELIVTSP